MLQLSICSDSSSRLRYRIQPGSVICRWRVLNTKNSVLKATDKLTNCRGWMEMVQNVLFKGVHRLLQFSSDDIVQPRNFPSNRDHEICSAHCETKASHAVQLVVPRSGLHCRHCTESGLTATCCIVSQICKSIRPQDSNPGMGENSIILTPTKRASCMVSPATARPQDTA